MTTTKEKKIAIQHRVCAHTHTQHIHTKVLWKTRTRDKRKREEKKM